MGLRRVGVYDDTVLRSILAEVYGCIDGVVDELEVEVEGVDVIRVGNVVGSELTIGVGCAAKMTGMYVGFFSTTFVLKNMAFMRKARGGHFFQRNLGYKIA